MKCETNDVRVKTKLTPNICVSKMTWKQQVSVCADNTRFSLLFDCKTAKLNPFYASPRRIYCLWLYESVDMRKDCRISPCSFRTCCYSWIVLTRSTKIREPENQPKSYTVWPEGEKWRQRLVHKQRWFLREWEAAKTKWEWAMSGKEGRAYSSWPHMARS